MMLALTAEEEAKCSGEPADVSALSASGGEAGEEGATPLLGTEGRRKEGGRERCTGEMVAAVRVSAGDSERRGDGDWKRHGVCRLAGPGGGAERDKCGRTNRW